MFILDVMELNGSFIYTYYYIFSIYNLFIARASGIIGSKNHDITEFNYKITHQIYYDKSNYFLEKDCHLLFRESMHIPFMLNDNLKKYFLKDFSRVENERNI